MSKPAARQGVGVYGLANYQTAPGRPGLLFGYAGLSEATIEEGVLNLGRVIKQLERGGRRVAS